jgi:hypothetical protein
MRRAFQGNFGLEAAPVLEFHLLVLVNALVKS